MSRKPRHTPEPDAETACRWWSDLRDFWTPVGWKDHMFRFNILYNGTVVAAPFLNERTARWKDQGVQLGFAPAPLINEKHFSRQKYLAHLRLHDDGRVRQGWNDCAAPVLWSEWAEDGLLLKQELFAHVAGGKDVRTGIEPLFLWIRLSVKGMCPAIPLEKAYGFIITIAKPHAATYMARANNLIFDRWHTLYPRTLTPDRKAYSAAHGYRLMEKGNRVRMGIAPGRKCNVRFDRTVPKDQHHHLYVQMDARIGARVDILVPMVPCARDVFNEELSAGYRHALKEANRYWTRAPRAAARIRVPEPFVNETVKHSLKFSEVISEKNPATGDYSLLTSSWTYAKLWPTMLHGVCTMLLDSLGRHSAVEKYLDVFRKAHGAAIPPGSSFERHPGYLCTPRELASIDWLTDHGAILHVISSHALISNNQRFLKSWLDVIVKACEFIKDARRIRNHGGVQGLMPPAVCTDHETEIQAVWSDGWMFKGLTAAVKVLRRAGHERAAEFEAEAIDYRRTFVKALREKCRTMPRWKDKNGRRHVLVPTALHGDEPRELRHAFYLDTGPLFLVYAGLLRASDPIMRDALLWFREGPQTASARRDSAHHQMSYLDHEISSCEPCCSWNIFHSHQLGDRQRYLEGMYSLFAGAISRQTFISCESRGGITGNIFSAPLATYLARLAVIDDRIKDDELHLLRLMPLAWLRRGEEAVFERMPTVYGPVSLNTRMSRNGKTLAVDFKPEFHTPPRRVLVHRPPLENLERVRVTGQRTITSVPTSGKYFSLR